MKYSAQIRIHDSTPFRTHDQGTLHTDIEWFLFDCADVNRAWSIPLWYWYTHNPKTPGVIHNELETRTVEDGSKEIITAAFIQEPDLDTWIDATAYALNSKGIPNELKIRSSTRELTTPKEFPENPNQTIELAARELWSKNFNSNALLVRGDTTVELNCSSFNNTDPTHTRTYDVADYGNATDLVRAMFLAADERRHG